MPSNQRPGASLGPTIYRDALHLYLEFPALPPAQPVALRFDLTDAGLAKALHHIPLIPSYGYVTGAGNLVADRLMPKARVARATAQRRAAARITDAQRASASAILRNLRSKS